MRITINGDSREAADDITLLALVQDLSLPSRGVAVEVNRKVVRRRDWESFRLDEDDRVEIVHFVGGG